MSWLQIVVAILFIIFWWIGGTLVIIQRMPLDNKPVMFIGNKFGLILGMFNLLLFFGAAFYLGFTWWPLILIALSIGILSRFIVSDAFVLKFIISPLYTVYSSLTSKGNSKQKQAKGTK